jgi:hypothetical protein
LVKPTSVRTPTVTWLGVTPWSVLPDALPPWQMLVRLPKVPAAAAGDAADAGAGDDAAGLDPCVLLDPARLQPAATTATTARAAAVLITGFTGLPP